METRITKNELAYFLLYGSPYSYKRSPSQCQVTKYFLGLCVLCTSNDSRKAGGVGESNFFFFVFSKFSLFVINSWFLRISFSSDPAKQARQAGRSELDREVSLIKEGRQHLQAFSSAQ